MATTGGLTGQEGNHRGHPGLTPGGRESLSHAGCTARGHPFPSSKSYPYPYGEGHRGHQHAAVSLGAPSHSATTSRGLPSLFASGNVHLPAGNGRHGNQPGHPTQPDCSQPMGNQSEHDGGFNSPRSSKLPHKLAIFSGQVDYSRTHQENHSY